MKQVVLLSAGIAIGLVGGLLVGRQLPGSEEHARTESPEGPPSSERHARSRGTSAAGGEAESLAALLGGRAVEDLSVDQINEIVSTGMSTYIYEDPVVSSRRFYQVQLLLSKLPGAKMAELARAAITGDQKGASGHMFFHAWAVQDWSAALAWADSEPKAAQFAGTAISVLATSDPRKAAEVLRERLLAGKGTPGGVEIQAVSREMAKLGKDSYFQFLDSLPSSGQGKGGIPSINFFPPADVLPVMDELYKRQKNGTLPSIHFDHFLAEVARENPAKADEWLGKIEPGPDKATISLSLATQQLLANKWNESADLLKSAIAQSPGKEKELLKKFASLHAGSRPEIIPTLANALPQGMEWTADDFRGPSIYLTLQSYDSTINTAKLINRPEERAKMIAAALDSCTGSYTRGRTPQPKVNEAEFKNLESRLATLDLTGENAAAVSAALQRLREVAVLPPRGPVNPPRLGARQTVESGV